MGCYAAERFHHDGSDVPIRLREFRPILAWLDENYAPPNCDVTPYAGPLRGVFSVPNKSAAQAWIMLPDSSSTMDTSSTPQGQGFIYIEGWQVSGPGLNPGPQNMEAGFQYNAGSDTYTAYLASPQVGHYYIPGYTISPNQEVILWEGAVIDRTVTVPGSYYGTSCVSFPGCVGIYFAYPIPGRIYADFVVAPAYHWVPGNNVCCVFQRVASISDKTGTLLSQTGFTWTFGPVQWLRSFTETFNPNATPNPNPSATPGYNTQDGDGTTDGSWVIGTSQNLSSELSDPDAPGYTTYPRCVGSGEYFYVSRTNNEIENDTVHLPLAYPNC